MTEFIPSWDWNRVIVEPWTIYFASYFWTAIMGLLVAMACSLVGQWMVLRRIALMGDAISHSVLPGLALAFIFVQSRGPWAMFFGALAAGIVTTFLIEVLQRKSRIKADSAIGIVFSTLFALGVVLISIFSGHIDLDTDCVLYGEIALIALEPKVIFHGVEIAPPSVLQMILINLIVLAITLIFYRPLLVSSFDSALADSLGLPTKLIHYSLMTLLSIVIVSSFKAVGAILVVAMLILPAATARLLSDRLPHMMTLGVLHAALSAFLGIHLAVWLNCSIAAAMTVAGGALFGVVWLTTSYCYGRMGGKSIEIQLAR